MSCKSWSCCTAVTLFFSLSLTSGGPNFATASARAAVDHEVNLQTDFITAEELKAKLSRNEPVMIIDVRSGNSLNTDNKIKGAYYVKLRRLKYRLGFPPLKNAPRDRVIVTYCACPDDEASVRAAQILRDSGFKHVRVLKGGWVVWKKTKGQIEPLVRGL
ncbi:MAG: rhodanese-like domain-containing protein [Pyrinomonadaceae bacterium]